MDRYSTGAIILHWAIALALAAELALGFGMPKNAAGFELFQLHKSLGISILALTLVRVAWKLTHPAPAPLEAGPSRHLATLVHAGFYAFLILAPLTGWAVVSTSAQKIPTILFGTVPLPHLPLSQGINGPAESTHWFLAWGGLGLLAAHILGVLRHEWLLRDQALNRIAPFGSRATGIALALSVCLTGFATYALATKAGPADPASIPGSAADSAPPVQSASPSPASAAPTQDSIAEDAGQNAGPVPIWTIAPGGRLEFSVATGAGDTIEGSFRRWSGKIAFDPDRPALADILIKVDLASASVGDVTQDAMLAGVDYFDTAQSSMATFRSTSVRSTGPDRFSADGSLTLKNMRLPQTINFRLAGSGLQRKIVGEALIARSRFGIGNGPTASDLAAQVALSFSFTATGQIPTR